MNYPVVFTLLLLYICASQTSTLYSSENYEPLQQNVSAPLTGGSECILVKSILEKKTVRLSLSSFILRP